MEKQQRTETFFPQLLDSVRESVVATDLDGRVMYWGKGAQALYGYTEQEVMGQPITFIVGTEGQAAEQARMRHVLETGEWRGQYMQQRQDGSSFWADTTISLIRDRDGTPVGFIGIDRDITAQKETQAALQMHQTQLETLLQARSAEIATAKQQWEATIDALPQIVCLLDENGVILRANRAVENWGLGPVQAVRGRTLHELLHPHCTDIHCPWTAQWAEALARATQGDAWEDEVWDEHCQKHFYVQIRPTTCADSSPQSICLSLLIDDVTAAYRARQSLAESEQRYRLLAENATDMISRHSLQGHYLYASPACTALLGYNANELVGRSAYEFFHPDDKPKVGQSHLTILKVPSIYMVNYRMRHRDGHYTWVETTSKVVHDPETGEVLEIIAITRDITERKRVENLQAAQLRLIDYAVNHSIQELLQRVLDEAETLTDSQVGFYHFVEEDQQTLSLQAWSTNTLAHMCQAQGVGLHYPINEAGVWVDCVHARKPVIHNDYASLPHRKGFPDGHAPITRELVVPVLRSNKIVAILGVGNKKNDYDDNDVETLSKLADVAWETVIRKQTEKILHRSEELHRVTLENISDPVFITDNDGCFTFICPNVPHLLGYTVPEVQAMGNIEVLIGEQLVDQTTLEIHSELTGIKKEIVDKWGHRRVFLIDVKRVSIQQGTTLYVWHEFTAQKELQEALKERDAMTRALLNATTESAALLEPDGTLVALNQAIAQVFGQPIEALIGRCAYDLLPPQVAQGRKVQIERVIRSGQPARFEDQRQGRHIDNSIYPVFDEKGAVVRIAIFGRDITAEKQARQALSEREALYHQMFAAHSAVMLLIDPENGQIVQANASATRFYGYDADTLQRMTIDQINTLPPQKVALRRQEAASRESSYFVFQHRLASGHIRDVEVHSVPIQVQDRTLLYSIIHDITKRKKAESMLRESEARFHALFNMSPDAILLVDVETGVIADANPMAEMLFKRSRAEIIGLHHTQLYPPDQRDLARRSFVLPPPGADQEVPMAELDVLCADGERRTVEIRGQLIELGNRFYAAGAFRDISERKRAEERLWASEQKYRLLFSEMHHGCALHEIICDEQGNAIDYITLEVNRAFESLLNTTQEDVVGKRASEILPHEELGKWAALFGQVVLTGQATYYQMYSDFNQKHFEGTAYCPQKGQFAVIFEDVTEQKRAEQALQASEARFRAIIESSEDHIFMLSPEGVYLTSNDRVSHFRLPRGESLVGRHLRDFYPPDVAEFYEQKLAEVVRTGRAITFEHPLPGPDGECCHLVTLYPILRDGQVTSVGGSCRDITERKQVEAALQAYADQLRTLASRLAEIEEAERQRFARELHDQIGQNLTALGINLNIVRSLIAEKGTEMIQARLDDALALVEQTTERVRDVMADLRPPVLDDYGLLAALRWYAEQTAIRTGISISVAGNESTPRLPTAVEVAFFRIAQEAITNVSKHAQASEIHLKLRSDAHSVQMIVADDGVGFDPSMTYASGGRHGWGLLTMTERAQAVGASCQIDSRPGQGTRVIVEVAK
ncbi:MAG: PAS domain S-box protein [Anaerolineae bacterium]|nr:PAS domain S-box protein [Anaerolineae bacterium]